MRLLRIEVEGFRSFLSRQELVLPDKPGLYLMRGENLVDESLQGNDCGKSTLLDAMYWGLFGETTRGLRAGNVVSWGVETAVVEQVWSVGGREVVFRRQQHPNGLWIDGRPQASGADGNAAVEAAVGMNSSEFLHAVLAGQFSTYFLDLSPADKLGVFSAVLDLDYWERGASAAAASVAEAEAAVREADLSLQNVSGRLSGLREQLESVRAQSDEWRKRRRAARREDVEKIKEARRRLGELDSKAYGVRKTSEEIDKSLREAVERLNGLSREGAEKESLVRKLSDDLGESKCPFCGGVLTRAWRSELRDQLKSAKNAILDLTAGEVVARREIAILRKQLAKVQETAADLSDKRADASARLRVLEAHRDEEETNPHEESLGRLAMDVAEARAQRKELAAARDKAAAKAGRRRFWVKGFRDLRLWVLDASLSELEMRVNNSLTRLGLSRWSVRMAVERENKSGGVTRGFLVDVRSPESAEGEPWKSWGGGVSQRLRIAAEIGLGHLIADRKGVEVGCEFWDEPDSHLSEQGIQDLLGHLQERAAEEGRQVWVVSHRSIQYPFDGELLVTKTGEGSRISMV